jgi:hypothetical protein
MYACKADSAVPSKRSEEGNSHLAVVKAEDPSISRGVIDKSNGNWNRVIQLDAEYRLDLAPGIGLEDLDDSVTGTKGDACGSITTYVAHGQTNDLSTSCDSLGAELSCLERYVIHLLFGMAWC